MLFGIVRSSEEDLLTKFKIKDTPTIIIHKTNEKLPIFYKGDVKFKPIFVAAVSELEPPPATNASLYTFKNSKIGLNLTSPL